MKILDTVFVYRLAKGERLAYHGRYHAHGSGEFEIHLFLDGAGSFLLNKSRISIEENSLFFCAPYEFHSIIPDKVTKPITYYAVLFSVCREEDADLFRLISQPSLKRVIRLRGENANRFLYEELLRLFVQPDEGCKKSAHHLLASFLYRWYSSPGSSVQKYSAFNEDRLRHFAPRSAVQEQNLKKALLLFENGIRQKITIQEIAYKLGFSAEHFIRFFREHMHITPHQYFMRLKAETASAMLITSRASVAEIAEKLGFETQFHFSRVFKKCTGIPPLTYRKWYSQSV